jgi:AcrR family transcriptional regulator
VKGVGTDNEYMTSDGVSVPRKRIGRRPGSADTRGTILEAARAEFAARGYERASLRGIARAARVDPALIHHYFNSKDQLFLAALDFPVDPLAVVESVMTGPREALGERLAGYLLALWQDPGVSARLTAILRSAGTSEPAAAATCGFLMREVVSRLAAAIDAPEPSLRAELVMTQIVGLGIARFVL